MESFTQQPEQDSRKLETAHDTSGLKFFSMALVVHTPKEQPSTIIQVTPIESLTIQDSGSVAKDDVKYRQTHQDANGAYSSQPEMSKNNIIEAEWLPLSDSNRVTPPCVYQDESVMVFKYKDVQKYYWCTIKHQPQLRRKEMVRWSASNETSPLVAYTKESSYFIEFNAFEKRIEIQTPIKDEVNSYRILLDVGAGQMGICDNQGNSMVIFSERGVVDITARRAIVMNAGESVEINAPTTTINSENIWLNGYTEVSKSLRVDKDHEVLHNVRILKDLKVGGLVKVDQTVTAQHIYSGVSSGGGFSSDIPVDFSSNQRAATETSAFNRNLATPPNTDSADPPATAADKSCRVDSVATANKSPDQLTGSSVLDAPKLATNAIPKSFVPDIPQMGAIKESVSKISSVGQQIASSTSAATSSISEGVQSLVNSAKSVQSTVSGSISAVTSSATAIVSQAKMTVMDPINSVTREINSITNSAVEQVRGMTSGFAGQVNGFMQPINDLSKSLTGKSVGSINQLNALTNKVYQTTGKIYNVNTAITSEIAKITTPINSLSSAVAGGIRQVNYAAVNITEPLRVATNTISDVQASAQSAKQQLSSLADQTSSLFTPKVDMNKLR